jgi:hypothetical protein
MAYSKPSAGIQFAEADTARRDRDAELLYRARLLSHFFEVSGSHFSSGLRLRVVDFNLEHWVSCKQFCCRLGGRTRFREVDFEVPINNHCVTLFRCDISPLNISGLLLFNPESWSLHLHFLAVRRWK